MVKITDFFPLSYQMLLGLGLCGEFVSVRQRRRRATAQWTAFQRRCWVAGAGQLACSKHVNTGIVWIGRDNCGFDWPHKSWWCFVIILLRVASSFYSSRKHWTSAMPSVTIYLICVASPLNFFSGQFFFSISISSGLTHWIFSLYICVPSSASAWIAE